MFKINGSLMEISAHLMKLHAKDIIFLRHLWINNPKS